jgi:hypothetical protein
LEILAQMHRPERADAGQKSTSIILFYDGATSEPGIAVSKLAGLTKQMTGYFATTIRPGIYKGVITNL